MKHLRNRTFDEYLALCAGFGLAVALLRYAIVHGDRISLAISLVLLLPLCLLVSGVDRAKFVLAALFIALGLYRLWAGVFGGARWSVGNLVMVGVPVYLALLFWRWSVSMAKGDDLSEKDFTHLKEQLRSMGCAIGEGTDPRSFGVGKDGVATLVSASPYALQFQTMIECAVPSRHDAERTLFPILNRLNSIMKIGRVTYEDGRVLMSASVPAHDPDGFTVQRLYLLWLQDVLAVRTDSEMSTLVVNQTHE